MTDGGEPYQQSSLARVRITVQDVNNIAPVFTRESYTEYIVENEPPGLFGNFLIFILRNFCIIPKLEKTFQHV